MRKRYDYLIVGAGLFGAVFAHEAARRGKSCLVIDKRDHIAGNIHCETVTSTARRWRASGCISTAPISSIPPTSGCGSM